ncbi:YfhO family protein [Anaerostipes hadrus]|uniref:YfhO family protein n=1 Tax=Anaerostipes hadrus TaxID=649756 RepID=UPI001D085FF8|nr:YfhO family protein [Anaerostipes hadrus]MCB6169591.1 YfhO family protein [Anaerostipes hadrus]MCB6653566.1 YfhO family protein [Anaerostipes hadrus]MCB6655996.1 YfhO family protein [Anaerostipes hadrus]MCB6680826.1 YfhO family protein [Anaerostipes hadrus]MCB6744438.1 YfhO family protein [Anaerostipes hadrus]
MIKEQRKYCYGVYTLMFLLMCIGAFLPFFTEGKSFVWGAGVEDGLSQHFSALAYYGEALREFFRNLLAGHPKLVMWDMSLGYGADILSTLNYYAIGDPLNLLYGFVSPKNTETMYDFMILLRMYLAGITFIMYARKMKKRSYGTVIGALVYVFSGFCFRLGLRHPFFINPIIYFPLLCLGIEKIYQRERPYVFIFAVCVSAMSNYYFLYMLTIFAVIYAWIRFYKYTEENKMKNFFLTILKFGMYYTLGIAMAAVILLPSVIGFLGNGRYGKGVDWKSLIVYPGKYYLLFIENFIGYGNMGSNTNAGYLPIVGIVVLFTLFSQRMKHKKYRVAFIASIIALILPIFGYAFNGFSYANNRWAFALSFIVALLTAEMYPRLFVMSKRQQIGIGAGIIIYTVFCIIVNASGEEILKNKGIMAACGLIAVFYILLLIFQRLGYDTQKRIVRVSMAILLLISVGVHGCYRFDPKGYAYTQEFMDQGQAYRTLKEDNIRMLSKVNDPSVYRVHAEGYRYKNYGLINHLNTISGYYSITAKCVTDTIKGYDTLGMQYADKYKGVDQRLGLLSLAGVKYITVAHNSQVAKDVSSKGDVPYGVEKQSKKGNITLYKNKYALPFAYAYDSYMTEQQYEQLNGIGKEQAMLAQIILNQHPADKEIQHNEQRNDPDIQTISLPETRISSPKGKKYADITVPVEKDKETYLYFKNLVYHGKKNGDDNFILTGRKGTKGILVTQNDVQQKIHIQSTFNPYYFGRKDYIVKINHQTSKAKEKVRLNFLSPGEYEFDDISLITVPKKDVLARLKERKENSMKQIQYEGNHFRGVYHAKKDQILCVTIPYSKGWKATVNGNRTKIYKANGMFMGIIMKKGTQSVKLDYETPGLKIGAWISLVAWIGLGIYGLYFEKYRKKLLNQC